MQLSICRVIAGSFLRFLHPSFVVRFCSLRIKVFALIRRTQIPILAYLTFMKILAVVPILARSKIRVQASRTQCLDVLGGGQME